MNPLAPLNLGGNRSAMRHAEDSFDRFPTRGMPSIPGLHDPVSDCPTGQRRMRCGNGTGVCRVDFARERVEQIVFVGEQIGLAVQNRCKIAASNVLEKRDGFVPDSIAQVGRIRVRGIVDRLDIERATQRLSLASAQRQNRVPLPIPMR